MKKLLTGYWPEYHQPFDTSLELNIFNLANDRVIKNQKKSKKSSSSLYSNFILNLFRVCELNN